VESEAQNMPQNLKKSFEIFYIDGMNESPVKAKQSALQSIDRSVGRAVGAFEQKQEKLRCELEDAATAPASRKKSAKKPVKPADGFGSSWLPGPLSYPWFLVVASIFEEAIHRIG
jgi:hypothetical protein